MKDVDPLAVIARLWPDVVLYKQQQELVRSVWENDETYCPAGNMLGKDYTAGLIITTFFITRHPCRIVTTSAKEDHLRVIWAEINRFLQTAAVPIRQKKGGNIIMQHQSLKKVVGDDLCPISYVIGMVASDQSIAAMQGHHVANIGDGIPRTLFVTDESSSVPEEYFMMGRTWCNRLLSIGNTWPCDNSFKWALKGRPGTDDKGGDIKRENGRGYHRKVVHIRATDSPNVRLALEEKRRGLEPSNRIIVPGVKSYEEYVKNRKLWDKIQQTVSLDAEFYEGQELKLFPADWLKRARWIARKVADTHKKRVVKAIGVDPGEGSANTAYFAVDEYGIIDWMSLKTPDTTDVPEHAIEFGKKHNVPANQWWFDRGGGGKQHVDWLRKRGYNAKTVSFGEPIVAEPSRAKRRFDDRKDDKELQYTYKNRRSQMYGILSQKLDPTLNPDGFGIPDECVEIFSQLAPIPKVYDSEGKLALPPKNKPSAESRVVTLIDLIGASPDEADALALAVYGMTAKATRAKAGVVR